MRKDYSERGGGQRHVPLPAYPTFFSIGKIQAESRFTIGTNHFTNNSSIPLTAINVDNCRDMVLSENEIENFDIGLAFKEVNVRTQFSCNIFDGCMTGVYFQNATMSDQGDGSQGADNQWAFVPSSGVRMNGNTSLTPAIDYYFDDSSADFDPNHSVGIPPAFFNSINGFDINSGGCYAIAVSSKTTIEKGERHLTQVYPNPFDHKFTISSHASFRYRIVDLVGKEVTSGFSNESMKEIELNIPPGMYMVIVQYGVNEKVFKLIKQ